MGIRSKLFWLYLLTFGLMTSIATVLLNLGLAETPDGDVFVCDAKINFDDNAAFRQAPSRATTQPRLTTRRRGGWATMAWVMASPSTTTRLPAGSSATPRTSPKVATPRPPSTAPCRPEVPAKVVTSPVGEIFRMVACELSAT